MVYYIPLRRCCLFHFQISAADVSLLNSLDDTRRELLLRPAGKVTCLKSGRLDTSANPSEIHIQLRVGCPGSVA